MENAQVLDFWDFQTQLKGLISHMATGKQLKILENKLASILG